VTAPSRPPQPVLTPRARRRNRAVAVIGLVAIWVLLWGNLSWANVLGGLVVAAVVLTVFPLPPVTFAGTVRPLAMLRYLVRFLYDLVVASFQIALLAFQFNRTPHSAVIAVPMRVNTDLNLTLAAESVSLVPGSLIVEADRAAGILYIHVLGVGNRREAEEFRRGVYEVEARIVAAIGTAAELQAVQLPPPAPPPSTGSAPPADRKDSPP
jgi:multicomponent Na+:H+ antiporter subunit E